MSDFETPIEEFEMASGARERIRTTLAALRSRFQEMAALSEQMVASRQELARLLAEHARRSRTSALRPGS